MNLSRPGLQYTLKEVLWAKRKKKIPNRDSDLTQKMKNTRGNKYMAKYQFFSVFLASLKDNKKGW